MEYVKIVQLNIFHNNLQSFIVLKKELKKFTILIPLIPHRKTLRQLEALCSVFLHF
jgi:hypothetical protein